MRTRSIALSIALILLAATSAAAKGKSKAVLPPYVLQAQTFVVLIDPDAGLSLDDPTANQIARKDVEDALQSWGRMRLVTSNQPADLIVIVRRGHGRLVSETIPDPRQNDRAGGISASDDGMQVGARQGTPNPQPPGPPGSRFPQASTGPRTEIGGQEDLFAVYDGKVSKPLDSPAGWRYTAPDALRRHSVPAVAEFRKAVAAAEKAASQP